MAATGRRLVGDGRWYFHCFDFFSRYGALLAVITLLFMGSYQLSRIHGDQGSMANSFYINSGLTRYSQIAAAARRTPQRRRRRWSRWWSPALRLRAACRLLLIAGSLMIMLSNIGFSLLARAATPTLLDLGLVNAFDNLAQAMHGTALIAFLSSLTSARYTATQYALFSSLPAPPGKS